ncbi:MULTISPECIES: hypothetical protein [Arthrobacter]|uniref:Uncharacterized protein n=1 Tax=Arthrobacter terricola TaxID=2547396 RepID=A0A4V6PI93_9MICC|nr:MULTISPECIES: hypothetical protein [Arthrobacter]MBT8163868.1 hypothetical protein [Arthrobacter sp. GN70]TDF84720.1 hypothetical protein E1809_26010 [Arthrobacter terricola]
MARPRPDSETQLEAATTAAMPSSRLVDSLRTQLRSLSEDLDHLAAENTEQRAIVKSLRADLGRLQTARQTDVQDLVHLAGKLLAFSHAAGVELHDSTKALFRRRGWVSTSNHGSRNSEAHKQ